MDHIAVGNRIDFVITGLTTAADTDTLITDATITFSVFDSDGTVVPGMDAVSIPHVSSGNYRGSSTPTTDLTAGDEYQVKAVSSNYDLTWDETFLARDRAFDL